VDVNGLEAVLLSDNSKILELEIDKSGGPPIVGLTRVLQALGRHPTLTKLILNGHRLGRDDTRLQRMALCTIPSLQSLGLRDSTLGNDELAELAPALYQNTCIKELDISENNL
jgi:hypothetical protein